ncbi:hypothetical protein E1B28_002053 [Marasmius oreades]|uniref:ER-bound oxygenase mpaB/mpaB'/Rubber oxygenase catalytic domain-containing protein n=1 Tax=Marasmius oreades TaxID=181124 RepID=A0A9P7V4R9_9AGAR|nr:uncharacterized protein E1B28_002053 [Marasmius oreades]KAG7100280.1 hypothetical protein E1B28_002053 [Marasmius oreades]
MVSLPVCCLAIYLLIVRILRYRRVNRTSRKYADLNLDAITPQKVQEIVYDSLFYDMVLGTQVTLFKIYGVPTIATLLLKSGEMTDEVQLNKRLADTATLIATFISNPSPPCSSTDDRSDPRAAIALARINYIHEKYPIRNEDLLYNLALFMLEPVRWTARFNWRPHTSLEKKAIFILWTDAGRRMGIENIWSSYEEMENWAHTYEEENMIPSESAYNLSRITINHMLNRVPSFPGLKSLAYNVFLTLLDERTRYAMGLPAPNRAISSTIYALFHIRAWIVHYLCLPRFKPALWVQMNMNPICPSADEIPRMHAVYPRRSGPYYFPEPTGYFAVKLQRLLLALGLKNPDKIPGKRWRSEGYRLEELGPVRWENEGHEEVMAAAAQMQGCPISGPWSLDARKGREKKE